MKSRIYAFFLILITPLITVNLFCAANIQEIQEEPILQLLNAIQYSDINKVEKLAKENKDLIKQKWKGFTHLSFALLSNSNLEMIKKLIDLGANVNDFDKKFLTPLIQIADTREPRMRLLDKKMEIAELILINGADTELKNENGQTALMLASKFQNIPLMKLLLANKANVNAAGDGAWTPLIYNVAAYQDDYRDESPLERDKRAYESTRLLLDAGADTETRDKFGRSAMDIANQVKNHIAAKLLKEEPARREKVKKHREQIKKELDKTGLPKVLADITEGYLSDPATDYTEAESAAKADNI